MREGGTNQPAPIVHNGVIYLPNIGGVLQAIDGANGKIIWESTVGGLSTFEVFRFIRTIFT